jgi:hypothetical protein
MPPYPPTLATTVFDASRPAAWPGRERPEPDARLPLPLAAAIILGSSAGLWLLLWKLAGIVAGL